ncbi:MAG: hypothetical protein ABW199_13085 [Caulobacterales bacterium]
MAGPNTMELLSSREKRGYEDKIASLEAQLRAHAVMTTDSCQRMTHLIEQIGFYRSIMGQAASITTEDAPEASALLLWAANLTAPQIIAHQNGLASAATH